MTATLDEARFKRFLRKVNLFNVYQLYFRLSRYAMPWRDRRACLGRHPFFEAGDDWCSEKLSAILDPRPAVRPLHKHLVGAAIG